MTRGTTTSRCNRVGGVGGAQNCPPTIMITSVFRTGWGLRLPPSPSGELIATGFRDLDEAGYLVANRRELTISPTETSRIDNAPIPTAPMDGTAGGATISEEIESNSIMKFAPTFPSV